MPPLDPRTIVFGSILTYVACTAVIAGLWRQSRSRFAGTTLWVLEFGLQTAALIFISLRGLIPDWLSVVGANAMIIAGALSGFIGLERFVGRRGSQIHNYVLLAVFAGAHAWFAFVRPDLTARNLNSSLGLLVICFQCMWLLVHRVEPGLRRLTRGVGAVYGLYCLLAAVRIVVYSSGAHTANDYFQSGAFETLVLIAFQVLFILMTYSLALMVNKRLLLTIDSQEERFFEEMPVALYRTAPTGAILDVNKALLDLLGFPDKRSLLARNATELYVDPAERDAFRREIERSGIVNDMQVRLRGRDGREIHALLSARVVRETRGGASHHEGSLKDITERLRAETESKRAERLEAVGQLAAGIAHDFNNILAGIRGFAEFLAMRPQSGPRVKEAGERILLASNRAARIVDGLLTTLGTYNYKPVRVNLDEMVRTAFERGAPPAGGSVKLELELSGAGVEINADREALETAFRELQANAAAASPEGGRVLVRTGLGPVEPAYVFAPQGELGGSWAWVSVIDRGRGMDERTLDHIFEPYFTTHGFGTGAGLGLPKVLGIVRQHGGFVGISSRPGEGTKATLYLPV